MKDLIFGAIGILFGITMTKSQAISWFRILEMFRLESFHMFGIIGTAVLLGIPIVQWMKRSGMKSLDGQSVTIKILPLRPLRHLLAGTVFGLGWALAGACPGPLFVLVGNGYAFVIVVIAGAVLGTWCYAKVRDWLPH